MSDRASPLAPAPRLLSAQASLLAPAWQWGQEYPPEPGQERVLPLAPELASRWNRPEPQLTWQGLRYRKV